MTALTIKDIPDDVLAIVKTHAAEAGKSLEAYMLELLAHEAARGPLPPVEETRGERAVRRLRGSATNPETVGMSTDELMELLRGD